jgi:hypothetical protein
MSHLMKNYGQLTEAAAAKGLYTRSNIPPQYRAKQTSRGSEFDFYTYVLQDENKVPDEVLNKFTSDFFYRCYEQEENFSDKIELYVIERGADHIFLSPKGHLCRLLCNKNKYAFHPHYAYLRKWSDISHHLKKEAIKEAGLSEPNRIGVFTEKKVLQWLQYCDTYIEVMEALCKKADSRNDEIEAEIKTFIQRSGGNVSTYHNITDVTVKGLFEVRFEHNKESQYLSTKIEFRGAASDLLNLLNI